MEVTKYNYKEALKTITSLLKEADFISFDSELSGLGRSLGDKNHDLDTPEERYIKAAKRVREYGLIQMGISIFRFCRNSKKYLSTTYSFYLSGKLFDSYRYDTSSMIFLSENGFDFNKLFLEGLTFMSLAKEVEIRKKREEKLKEEDSTIPSPIKLRDDKSRTFVKEAIQKVKDSKKKGECVSFEGKSMHGFFRKILFSNVAPLFPTSHFHVLSGSERNVKVQHFNSEEEKMKFVDDSWEKEFNEKMGFTHVVKAILESDKPLVGHNIILDILHFVEKFVSPLPNQLNEFKSVVKVNLPIIYDTKLLARDPPFSADIMNTSLGCLYEELTSKYSPPEFDVETGCQSYKVNGTGQAHDAGFDAFMTGVCFSTMIKTLEGRNWAKKEMMKSKHLENYANRINFMGSYDIPFIDIDRADIVPDRSYIYSVTCPSTWSNMNVRHAFSCLKGYKTIWISDTHLYVVPQDEGDVTRAKKLLESIRSSCSSNVKVTMFDESKGVTNRGEKPVTFFKPRQASIALKRSSDAKETPNLGGVEPTDCTDSARNLKRLKSVGSELFSNMTLESPMSVDKELPSARNDESTPKSDSSQVFNVPDEW